MYIHTVLEASVSSEFAAEVGEQQDDSNDAACTSRGSSSCGQEAHQATCISRVAPKTIHTDSVTSACNQGQQVLAFEYHFEGPKCQSSHISYLVDYWYGKYNSACVGVCSCKSLIVLFCS